MFGIPEQPSKNSIVFLKENPLGWRLSTLTQSELDFSDTDTGDLQMPQSDFQRVAKQLDKVVAALSSVQIALAELNVRHEHVSEEMASSEIQYKAEILRLRDEINSLSKRIGDMEKLIWKAVGASAVLALAIPYLFKFIINAL